MTTRVYGGFALALLAGVAGLSPEPERPDPADIVRRHYPVDRLTSGNREQCFQVRNTDAEGQPTTIVAAYTDLIHAVLRVLTRDVDSEFSVTYDSPVALNLAGSRCNIKLLDVNGDGERDVFLDLSLGRHGSGWVFRWAGDTLENATPSETHLVSPMPSS